MKKYTVKKVVKLEELKDNLDDRDNHYHATLLAMISMLLSGAAASIFKNPDLSAIQTIAGTVLATGSASALIEMITVHFRHMKVENKLEDIYELMGKDFQLDVYDEYNAKRFGR